MKFGNFFYVFDFYVRDRFGKVFVLGSSVFFEFNIIDEFILYCVILVNLMNVFWYEQFEIIGVKVRYFCVYLMVFVIIENGDQFEFNEIELINLYID